MDEGIENIDRRAAIKRVGAMGAVAWSAPVLSSMSAPAFAQGGTDPPGACTGGTCGSYTPCSSANPDCICAMTSIEPGDGVFCMPGSTLCAGLTRCTGTPRDPVCPPFELCVFETCCGEPVCVPGELEVQCPPDPLPDGVVRVRTSSGSGTVGG
jgi:hypothetical protein